MRLFGDTSRNLRSNCSPFPILIGMDFVFQPGLFQKDRDLVAVGSRPIVEVDHRANSLTPDHANHPGTRQGRNRSAGVISDELTALSIRYRRLFARCWHAVPAGRAARAPLRPETARFVHLPQLAFAPPRVRIPLKIPVACHPADLQVVLMSHTSIALEIRHDHPIDAPPHLCARPARGPRLRCDAGLFAGGAERDGPVRGEDQRRRACARQSPQARQALRTGPAETHGVRGRQHAVRDPARARPCGDHAAEHSRARQAGRRGGFLRRRRPDPDRVHIHPTRARRRGEGLVPQRSARRRYRRHRRLLRRARARPAARLPDRVLHGRVRRREVQETSRKR